MMYSLRAFSRVLIVGAFGNRRGKFASNAGSMIMLSDAMIILKALLTSKLVGTWCADYSGWCVAKKYWPAHVRSLNLTGLVH